MNQAIPNVHLSHNHNLELTHLPDRIQTGFGFCG
jgi:hypothetical protein